MAMTNVMYDEKRVLNVTFADQDQGDAALAVRCIPVGMEWREASVTLPGSGWYLEVYDLEKREYLAIPAVDIIYIAVPRPAPAFGRKVIREKATS
jgi:hypothetical protein